MLTICKVFYVFESFPRLFCSFLVSIKDVLNTVIFGEYTFELFLISFDGPCKLVLLSTTSNDLRGFEFLGSFLFVFITATSFFTEGHKSRAVLVKLS